MHPMQSVPLYGDPNRGSAPWSTGAPLPFAAPTMPIRSDMPSNRSSSQHRSSGTPAPFPPGWDRVQFQVAAEAHVLQVVATAAPGREVAQPLRQILVYAANHLPADPLLSIADSGRLIGVADLALEPCSRARASERHRGRAVDDQRTWVAMLLESPWLYSDIPIRRSVAISAAVRAVRGGRAAGPALLDGELGELVRMLSLGGPGDRAIALTLSHLLTDTTPALAGDAAQALLRCPGPTVEADPLGFAATAVQLWHRAHRRTVNPPSLTAEQLAGAARALRISYTERPRP